MAYFGAIYIIKNTITGDCYIGQTRQKLTTRWANHKAKLKGNSHHSTKLQQGWNQYGASAFCFMEMFYALDAVYLNDIEKEIIRDMRPSYNMTSGGAGSAGKVMSLVERKRSSDRLKAKWADPLWREKHIQILKSSHNTETAVARMRTIQHLGLIKRWEGHVKKKKQKCTMTRSEIIGNSWKDEVIRAKRIAGLKAYCAQPEAREKRRLSSTGRVMCRESIEKSAKAKWKPILCVELNITFLCRKFAAEFLNINRITIHKALKLNRRVLGKYTFVEIR